MPNYDEEESALLSEEEICEIHDDYRRRRLVETLVGPFTSTIFHVALIAILAWCIKDQYKDDIKDVEVTLETVVEIPLPEPPKLDEPIIEPVKDTVPTPELLSVDMKAEENDSALDEHNDDPPMDADNTPYETLTDVKVSVSPTVTSPIGGRTPAGRRGLVNSGGGDAQVLVAVIDALKWLQKVQNPDGSWGTKNEPAYTGLALLTFLAHGETQTSKDYGTTVRKAMEWLAMSKHDTKSSHGYPHAIKTYALAEAYAMTGISLLEDAMNRSVRTVIDGIQDAGCYDYNYKKGSRADLSFAGWNYQALKAAYGAGCEEEGLTEAIYKGIDWLKERGASSDNGKGFPYSLKDGVAGGTGKHTMRAVGVLCLQLYGEGEFDGIKDEINTIATADLAKFKFDAAPQESLYGWYYATQAMFQAGGKNWQAWNKVFQRELKNSQHAEGYWEYPGKYHGASGDETTDRVYATTLCALMLTVYYRYLPSSKGAIGSKDAKKALVIDEGLDLIE